MCVVRHLPFTQALVVYLFVVGCAQAVTCELLPRDVPLPFTHFRVVYCPMLGVVQLDALPVKREREKEKIGKKREGRVYSRR